MASPVEHEAAGAWLRALEAHSSGVARLGSVEATVLLAELTEGAMRTELSPATRANLGMQLGVALDGAGELVRARVGPKLVRNPTVGAVLNDLRRAVTRG